MRLASDPLSVKLQATLQMGPSRTFSLSHLAYCLPFLASLLSIALGNRYFDSEELKPCPKLTPDSSVDISSLSGRWQLSLLILDASMEDLEENSACVNGEVTLLNSTHIRQVWDMFTPYIANEPTASFELIARSIRPGVWSVKTPLEGNLSATVFGSGPDYILITHCGWQRGQEVHLWTAAVTRGRLQPRLRLKLSKALFKAGFDPSQTKIITWSTC